MEKKTLSSHNLFLPFYYCVYRIQWMPHQRDQWDFQDPSVRRSASVLPGPIPSSVYVQPNETPTPESLNCYTAYHGGKVARSSSSEIKTISQYNTSLPLPDRCFATTFFSVWQGELEEFFVHEAAQYNLQPFIFLKRRLRKKECAKTSAEYGLRNNLGSTALCRSTTVVRPFSNIKDKTDLRMTSGIWNLEHYSSID